MNQTKIKQYKKAKTISEQIEHLSMNKNVQFDEKDMELAKNKLLEYNYINIISPFKHKFAKLNNRYEAEKINGKHIYEKNVDFNEYYTLFTTERKSYPIIITNILEFEIHFKTITAYHILISREINNSDQLKLFLDKLKNQCCSLDKNKYKQNRILRMQNTLDSLKNDIFKYADIYCFFDRMSLGKILTVFICLEHDLQNKIFKDLKKYQMTFNVDIVPHFIKKAFCLVSIRNCVMHYNSLEILIRFYDPKKQKLRNNSDRKKYSSMIKALKIEKAHN